MVKEGKEIPAKQSDVAFSGVPSSVSKQYLESVRGHYLSALAGLNTGKQEQINISQNVDAFSALDEDLDAGKTSRQGQLEHIETSTGMDMRIHVSKNVLGAPEKKFQTFKVRLCRTLAKNDEEEISKMVSQIRAFGWEVESETSELEANMTGHSEASDPKESSLKEVPEGSSLQSTVKSLKAQLENLKREHVELKGKSSAAENTSRNIHFKLPKSKFKDACFLSNEAKVRESLDEAVQSHQVEDLKIKNKGLKRRRGTSKVSGEGKKRARVAVHDDEAKDTTVSAPVPNKSLPGRMYPACVSTSESSARMMISEDKLEASSLKEKTSDKCERVKVMTGDGRADSEKYDSVSEFSIRDYVFASRNRDISFNWPFSQKNLQLCLKHGIKDVLPPFQSMDSLRNSSMKRFVAEPSCNSEESNLHNRPSLLKTHLVTETTIDHHFPSRGEKYLAFKTAVTVNSHSEVESVSTNNLPTSEVSDERVAAVSMFNDKMKSSASQFSDKSQLAVKIRMSNCRSAAEDITSSSTVPFEVMNSKICPVCETFSSSSNTTLNAHIDQCLSSQPSPNWVNNSKFVKPRVKPRKIRLMSDICATAPSCTLEDLDRRNGTNWATNVDVASQNAELVTEGKSHRVLSNYDVNNSDDSAVYIDSSGRKIRILSKFNDTLPSPLPKAKNDLGPEKHSKKGKTSRFFSSARKRRLAKHLKYLKANRHKTRFPALKVNRPGEVCGAEEATTSVRELVQFAKTEKHKSVGDSGSSRQWIPSKISSLSKKKYSTDINRNCRYELRLTKERRAADGLSNSARTHIKMHGGTLKKCTSVEQSRMRTPTSSLVVDKKREISCRNKTSGGSSSIAAIQGNRSLYVVPSRSVDAKFNVTNTKKGVSNSTDSTVSPSSSHEGQVDIHADSSEYVDCTFPRARKLLDSSQTGSYEGIRSQETKTKSPNFSSVHEDLSNSDRRGSLIEKSFRCRRNEKGDLWSVDRSQHSIGCHDHMMKVQRRRELKICNDVSGDHNRTYRRGGSRDPELRNVVSECLDEFRGPLFKNNVRTPTDERSPRGDEHATLYKDALGEEKLQFETNSDLHFGCQSFFQEVDPIPIPGPPGSDLPSFSDMGSEDIHRSSSLSGHLRRSYGNRDYVFDGDLSDSPLSATSTISNVGRKHYPTVSQSSKVTRPVSDSFYPGWLANSSAPVNRTFPSTFFSHFSVTERFASLPATSKESVISQKEWIPWSSSVNFDESRVLGPSSKVTSSVPRENLPSITPIEVAGASFQKAVVCDSVSPSTPTLRLMGKDLMVINKETIQNASRDTQVPSLCEHSSGFPSWKNQTSWGSVLIRPQVHEQDPQTFSTRLLDFGSSNVMNSNPKQASGGMYVDKPMHSTFHNSSMSPVQR